jgi:protein arginine kinase
MINEEDHIRAACFRPGLALTEAWETLSRLDDDLAGRLAFSYNAQLGYVTACPTNMGTGLRASCLLHLPALVMTGKIQHVINELAQYGLTARGFYGEGTMALGDLFQISNVRTLGESESQLIKEVEQAVKEICLREKQEHQNIQESNLKLRAEDLISRSFGTLQWARTLNLAEGMKHVSLVRLGLKLRKQLPLKMDKVTSFFFLSQPVHLQIRSPRSRTPVSVESIRADYFRGELKND